MTLHACPRSNGSRRLLAGVGVGVPQRPVLGSDRERRRFCIASQSRRLRPFDRPVSRNMSTAGRVAGPRYVVEPPPVVGVPVLQPSGSSVDDETQPLFPVRRVYCVGRNYAEHAVEMGGDPTREPPFFFSKPRDAVLSDANGGIAYPPNTGNLQYEVELVVAIGKGGTDIAADRATRHVYGYAVGIDLTRRDLQSQAKQKGRPWTAAKEFDRSAPVSCIVPVGSRPASSSTALQFVLADGTHRYEPEQLTAVCTVNGQRKQHAKLSNMIWSVPEIISVLSKDCRLQPGDLIFTGTPAGVGPIVPGDIVHGTIGLSEHNTNTGDDDNDNEQPKAFVFPAVEFRIV